jgi:hypothetical protein
MFYAQQITSYLMGGKCMRTNLFYRAANKFRFYAPSTVMTLSYMAYRARGAYLQDGLFTVHNSDFRRIKNSRKRIVLARLLGRGAARTSNGVPMSAAGQPGAYATRKAISSNAASTAAASRGL